MAHWGEIRSPNENNDVDWQTPQNGVKQNQGLTDEMANLDRPPDPENENAASTEIDNGANHLKAVTFEAPIIPMGLKNAIVYDEKTLLNALEESHPILITETKEQADGFNNSDIPAICSLNENWGNKQSEAVEGFDLVFMSDNMEFVDKVARALDGYIKTPCLVNPKGKTDLDALYDEAFSAPYYEFRDVEEARADIITATAYEWRDPSSIPRRKWLYGNHLIRNFVSCTIAPGGIGKSSLIIAEALAMVTGKDLLGEWAGKPKRVWLWNLEDPREEMERRIQAACLYHNISMDDLGDGLFLDTGRERELCIAETLRGHTKIAEPCFEQIVSEIKTREIDVLIIDPFVSSHRVEENDNNAIDLVVKAWGKIADATGCAIELVHHTRKQNGNEVNAESARGAGSLIAGVRDARTLNPMSEDEGAKAGVDNHRLYFRVQSDKANMAPPSDRATWYKKNSVDLGNGEQVAAISEWQWPDPFKALSDIDMKQVMAALRETPYRASNQAKNWVGKPIADTLDYDLDKPYDKAQVSSLIRTWVKNGVLNTVSKRCPKAKRDVPFIEVVEAGL